MPDRCCLPNYDRTFDAEEAQAERIRYRADGPDDSTQRLIDALVEHDVLGATLIDIGGGVGAVQLGLLEAGLASATDVDASAAYLAEAEAEAAERGYRGRVDYRHGDFVAVAAEVEVADVVTLDRVICCYPDVRALVSASSSRARRLYGVVYPLDRWWTRLAIAAENLWMRIQRDDYRAYVHPQRVVEGILRDAGFERVYRHAGRFWQTAVFARVSPPRPGPASAQPS